MNETPISFNDLPFEIVEYIFQSDILSYVDICHISCVSPFLNCVAKSDKLWQMKYCQMWPCMAELFDPYYTDWRKEFQLRIIYKKAINDKLEQISQEVYHLDNISTDAFVQMKNLCEGHPLTEYILVGELWNILHDSHENENLTIKYYAEKALVYVRHTMLETIWLAFLESEPRPSLLKGACYLQQWCQPSDLNCTEGLSDKVNELIEMVFKEVKEVCPSHPVIKKGYSKIEHDCGEVLTKSLWNPYDCKVILKCINEVLFKKLNWQCFEHFQTPEAVYINLVIDRKVGIPITVGIIYETIASQLGVHMIPMNSHGRFTLKWLEHPGSTPESMAWTYIDLTSKGAFKYQHELGYLNIGPVEYGYSLVATITPVKAFEQMCWSLVEVGRQRDQSGEGGISYLCCALELLSMLVPEDMDHKLLLARVYMHLGVNMQRVISLLQEIADNDPVSTGFVAHMYEMALAAQKTQHLKMMTRTVEIHKRDDESEVKFAVGMKMLHKKYHYRCVIYGWDPLCTASKDWIRRMRVHKLQYKHKQPFYNVLVGDGTSRYAAQENLEIDRSEEPIKHGEIGRHFKSFHGHYYEPNDLKNQEYPEDKEIRDRLLSEVHLPSENAG